MGAERVLVVVSVDPERSHRANEAVRIALGLVAADNVVTLVLVGPAVKILAAGIEECVDGEDLARHLATLKRLRQAFHVERDAVPAEAGWNPHDVPIVSITPGDLGHLIARTRRVLAF